MYKNAIETVLTLAAERGWNQTELGQVLGVTSAVVSNWKTRGLPADQLVPAARAFGVTVEALLGDQPDNAGTIPHTRDVLGESLTYLGRLVGAQRFEEAADEAQVLVLALRAAARRAIPKAAPSEVPGELADWVKAARTHAGLTLEQLGERLGRTKSNVGHWEAGKHEPSYRQVCEIARVTDYPRPGGEG